MDKGGVGISFFSWPIKTRALLLLIVSYSIQLVSSTLYGLRLFNEWGTDYGIYYVGANSISDSYGLYSGFFDLKGPLYYGFIKFLSLIFTYGKVSAVIILILTCLLLMLAVNLTAIILNFTSLQKSVLALASVVILTGQPSNSSMSIFQSSLEILSLGLFFYWEKVKKPFLLFLSISLGFLVILVKIDSLLFILIFVVVLLVRLWKNERLLMFKGIFLGILVTSALFWFLSWYLNFGFMQFWQQAVVFVFKSRYSIGNGSGLSNYILRDYNSLQIVLSTSLPFVIVLLLFLSKKVGKLPYFLLFGGLLNYLILASDKNYHLFVLYPYLLISLLIIMRRFDHGKYLRIAFVALFLSSISVILSFGIESRCTYNKNVQCENKFQPLIFSEHSKSDLSKQFLFNNGWPYLFNNVKPVVDFNEVWPLGVFVPEATSRILQNPLLKTGGPIYMDRNDLLFIEKIPGNFLGEFLRDTSQVPLGDSSFLEVRKLNVQGSK